ncbi:PREDICTED: 50S ribosomal protein 5 alpha, chloroplastic [Ipomoea nil]|uniref:50S ribosomal protein 5 alpha, chloroplastic n=1 Tax=Ipomoea nil TaxID=35883 RepID=UPI0009013741|nr:PREDICTED: 50S ribosomal protein 5 alpha, chloroplastic [Ipomoea nil]
MATALLLFTATPTVASLSLHSSSSSSSSSLLAAHPFSRFGKTCNGLAPRSYINHRIHAPYIIKERDALVVNATSDVDGVSADNNPESPSESKEENVSVENLPLESKLQEKLDQKTRMKIAKKIRLRRKRLLRKRHLRKIGRWPPSKLKKNKNV